MLSRSCHRYDKQREYRYSPDTAGIQTQSRYGLNTVIYRPDQIQWEYRYTPDMDYIQRDTDIQRNSRNTDSVHIQTRYNEKQARYRGNPDME